VAYAIALGMTTAAAVRPATRSRRSHSPRYCRSQADAGMRREDAMVNADQFVLRCGQTILVFGPISFVKKVTVAHVERDIEFFALGGPDERRPR